VVEATGGRPITGAGAQPILTSVSIDSRTLEPGRSSWRSAGKHFDGHDFLAAAHARGARAALVERDAPGPAGAAARARPGHHPGARGPRPPRRRSAALPVVAVTGSVGKTTTKT
jgi:UDP-N-acetylmuramoyl-tripeptide--D-alanyl-D-alanine ligase